MKKIYQKPDILTISIKGNSAMLSGSYGLNSTNATQNTDGTYGMSRRSNAFWDDEEYDEY